MRGEGGYSPCTLAFPETSCARGPTSFLQHLLLHLTASDDNTDLESRIFSRYLRPIAPNCLIYGQA